LFYAHRAISKSEGSAKGASEWAIIRLRTRKVCLIGSNTHRDASVDQTATLVCSLSSGISTSSLLLCEDILSLGRGLLPRMTFKSPVKSLNRRARAEARLRFPDRSGRASTRSSHDQAPQMCLRTIKAGRGSTEKRGGYKSAGLRLAAKKRNSAGRNNHRPW
jgi:hypothetical protein